MQCPVCKVELRMADRQGVEVDYCPQCRGVWLDRGEIDKIVEREMAYNRPQSPPQHSSPPQQPWRGGDYDDDDHRHGHYRKKKRGFLGDFLDFD